MIRCYQNRKEANFYHFLSQILALATTGHLLSPNIAFIEGSYLQDVWSDPGNQPLDVCGNKTSIHSKSIFKGWLLLGLVFFSPG